MYSKYTLSVRMRLENATETEKDQSRNYFTDEYLTIENTLTDTCGICVILRRLRVFSRSQNCILLPHVQTTTGCVERSSCFVIEILIFHTVRSKQYATIKN